MAKYIFIIILVGSYVVVATSHIVRNASLFVFIYFILKTQPYKVAINDSPSWVNKHGGVKLTQTTQPVSQ